MATINNFQNVAQFTDIQHTYTPPIRGVCSCCCNGLKIKKDMTYLDAKNFTTSSALTE